MKIALSPFYRLLFLALLSLFLPSCIEKKPDLTSTQKGKLDTVSFTYPKNWKITGDDAADDFKSLFIETSTDGILILKSYPLKDADGLKEFAQDFSECTESESGLMSMQSQGMTEKDGDLTEDLSITVIGQEVLFQRIYKSKDLGERRLYFILQETTDVIDDALPGLEHIYESTMILER